MRYSRSITSSSRESRSIWSFWSVIFFFHSWSLSDAASSFLGLGCLASALCADSSGFASESVELVSAGLASACPTTLRCSVLGKLSLSKCLAAGAFCALSLRASRA